MRVIPVGAGLSDGKVVGKTQARQYLALRHLRGSIHVGCPIHEQAQGGERDESRGVDARADDEEHRSGRKTGLPTLLRTY